MATSFSIVPLRLATFLGFSVTALSAIFIIFLIIEKILHPDLPAGWTSLIATILFIGGMQTLFIGLIGEYLGRAYLKLNRKPQYVIGSTTWSEANQND
jgi:undecaprenyl-phosphate 4-deoxy-4-formamido-L-arabinose transferase